MNTKVFTGFSTAIEIVEILLEEQKL